MQFKVIQTPRHERFEQRVSEALTDGWLLHGSPFIDGTGQMVQALTKAETKTNAKPKVSKQTGS